MGQWCGSSLLSTLSDARSRVNHTSVPHVVVYTLDLEHESDRPLSDPADLGRHRSGTCPRGPGRARVDQDPIQRAADSGHSRVARPRHRAFRPRSARRCASAPAARSTTAAYLGRRCKRSDARTSRGRRHGGRGGRRLARASMPRHAVGELQHGSRAARQTDASLEPERGDEWYSRFSRMKVPLSFFSLHRQSLRFRLAALISALVGTIALLVLLFFPCPMHTFSRKWVERRTPSIVPVLSTAVGAGL